MSRPRQRRHGGFTLLELLVALSIFAIMAVMAYAGLQAVLRTREHTDEAAKRLNDLQTAFMFLQSDIEQSTGRSVRDVLGDPVPAMEGASGTQPFLQLTRAVGGRYPGLERVGLQRVEYALVDGRLVRRTWAVLDRAQDSRPLSANLLSGVHSVLVRFRSTSWIDFWPPAGAENDLSRLPRAVEIQVNLDAGGYVRRLFAVAGA